MDDFTIWFNRNKCTIYKVGFAIFLSVVLVALFAGTAATGGAAATGLAGLLAFAGAWAAVLAKVLLVAVAVGVSASGIGDLIVCKVFMIDECCNQAALFWKAYGGFVEKNGGTDRLTADQCAELHKMVDSFKKVPAPDLEAIKKFLREHCDE